MDREFADIDFWDESFSPLEEPDLKLSSVKEPDSGSKLDSGQKLDIRIILPNEGTRFWSPKFDTGIILPNEGARFWSKKVDFLRPKHD